MNRTAIVLFVLLTACGAPAVPPASLPTPQASSAEAAPPASEAAPAQPPSAPSTPAPKPAPDPKRCYGFVVSDEGSKPGTGRVLQTKGNLEWMRHRSGEMSYAKAEDYCKSNHMRLPTKDEVVDVINRSSRSCAFPDGFDTWTSTRAESNRGSWSSGAGTEVRRYISTGTGVTDNGPNGTVHTICVR